MLPETSVPTPLLCGALRIVFPVHADVIKHAVEQNTQAPAVRFGEQLVEVGVVTEPGIDTCSGRWCRSHL